jgi:hypothetical protein
MIWEAIGYGLWFAWFLGLVFRGLITAQHTKQTPCQVQRTPQNTGKPAEHFPCHGKILPVLGKRLPSAGQGLPIGGDKLWLTIGAGKLAWEMLCNGQGTAQRQPVTKNQKDTQ